MKKNREIILFSILLFIFITIVVTNQIKNNDENNDTTNQFDIEDISTEKVTENETKKDVTVNKSEIEKASITKQAEYLDRGLVAVKTEKGVFLSWRFLGTDSEDTTFVIYKSGKSITSDPIKDSTNFTDNSGDISSEYYLEVLVDGIVKEKSKPVNVLETNYFDIPLLKPLEGNTPDGSSYTYSPNDASVGDLDGDGEYEIILKWEPSNAQDNSKDGYTGNVYIDAYKLDGTLLWRIDLGINIRAGAHYTQFMVYDFDCDGKAEMVCKTADGTYDGKGNCIGEVNADYRNQAGRILTGPEYLTLFDGLTGEALDTIDYEPARGVVSAWGDDYGNRVDRFLAAVAYIDGAKPSVIMCRGYYTRSVLAAYDIINKKFVNKWIFDTKDPGHGTYAGQGNHNIAVADVDFDGKDEIIYGQCTIDDNGKGLYSTRLGHGDAIHVGDFLPQRDGLEIWGCLEASFGAALRDAATGEVLLRVNASKDTGRAIAGNFIPGNNGAEFVSTANDNVYDANGLILTQWSKITKWSPNYAIYWDGDLEQEVLDRTMIDKYQTGRIFNATGVSYNNGTKANMSLCADILGDWREEIIWPTVDGNALRIFTTTELTSYRIFTLMHDMQYRCQIAAQNVAYNQGACTSFFLGTGYELPKQPNIITSKPKVQ